MNPEELQKNVSELIHMARQNERRITLRKAIDIVKNSSIERFIKFDVIRELMEVDKEPIPKVGEVSQKNPQFRFNDFSKIEE